jgi:Icc protein
MKLTGKRFGAVILAVLALLVGCAGVAVRENTEGGFAFVQITDTHCGAAGYLESIEKTVARINALPIEIDFVVHTGDIMNDNISDGEVVAEALAALAKLRVPIYYTPGNHDVSAWLPGEERTAWERHFGDLVHVLDHRGVRFIFAFTMPLEIGLEVEGYRPLAEIEALLEEGGGPAVILLHNPPFSERINPGDSLWRREAGALWNELLARHDVRAVLAGHLHTDELAWQGDTPLFITPSVYNHGGRPQTARFRVFTCKDGKLSYWTQAVD